MKKERLAITAKKSLVFSVVALLLLSSCSSNTATGAYTGAQFGHVLGSAIGGLSGGWKGQQQGTIIGMVGGAIAGAAIGKAVDRAKERSMADGMANACGQKPQQVDFLDISNIRIDDADGDGCLMRGEECTLTFELINNSGEALYNVRPTVEETTGNKQVSISPSLLIEHIAPHKGIRYTSTIKGGKRLKKGEIRLQVSIVDENRAILCKTDELVVPTKKE